MWKVRPDLVDIVPGPVFQTVSSSPLEFKSTSYTSSLCGARSHTCHAAAAS